MTKQIEYYLILNHLYYDYYLFIFMIIIIRNNDKK